MACGVGLQCYTANIARLCKLCGSHYWILLVKPKLSTKVHCKSMSLLLLANHVDLEWLNTDNDESKHVYMLHLDKGHLSLAKGSEGISKF